MWKSPWICGKLCGKYVENFGAEKDLSDVGRIEQIMGRDAGFQTTASRSYDNKNVEDIQVFLQTTKKELEIMQCAHMILRDLCPPDRAHYFCAIAEDDSAIDCVLCWDHYLSAVASGAVELPKTGRVGGFVS